MSGKSEIGKISRFQPAVKNALVYGFFWNLCQMKGLGLYFQDFFEFLIFVNFTMLYSTLNMDQIRIFRKSKKIGKSGSGPCSKCYKTCKNWRNFKFQKNLEKLILELLFDIGFIRIRLLARFLQPIEIYQDSGF